MGKHRCYVVIRGRKPGIYSTWEECKAEVHGYPNARFWGCSSEEEAVEALTTNYDTRSQRATNESIMRRLKRPHGIEDSPPTTNMSTLSTADDWKIVKYLVLLLLIALIALVVVLIATLVRMHFM